MNAHANWLDHLDRDSLTPGQRATLDAFHAARRRRFKRAAWAVVFGTAAAAVVHVGWVAVR